MTDNLILVSTYISEHAAADYEVNAGFLKLTDKRFEQDLTKMPFKIGNTVTMRNVTVGGVQYGETMSSTAIEQSGQQLTITDNFGDMHNLPLSELMFKFKAGNSASRMLVNEFYENYIKQDVDKIVQEAGKILLQKAALNSDITFGYSTRSIDNVSLLNTAKNYMGMFNMPINSQELYFLSDFLENDRIFSNMPGSLFTATSNEEVLRKGYLGKIYGIKMLEATDLTYIHEAGIGAGGDADASSGLIAAGTTDGEIANGSTTINITGLPPETAGVFNAGDILEFIPDISNPRDYANYVVYPLSNDTKKSVMYPLQRTIVSDADGNAIVTSDADGKATVIVNRPIYSLQSSRLRNVSNAIPSGTALAIHNSHKVNMLWTKPALVSVSPKMADRNLSFTASKNKNDLYISFGAQSNISTAKTDCRTDTYYGATARPQYMIKFISKI